MSLLRIALMLLVAYGAVVAVVFFNQHNLLYLPHVPGRSLDVTPAQLGLAYREVWLHSADGEQIHGWYVPAPPQQLDADAATGPRTLLFLHGNAGNISHRLESLRFWHQLGLSSLIIDYRGYGQSSGTPNETGTYLDALAAWQHLQQALHYQPDEILVFGRSLGGAVALGLAHELHAQQSALPAGLILESTFTSVPDLAAELYPWLPVRRLARIEYPNLERIGALAIPLLIAHSPDDEIINVAHGRALYAAANAPKTWLELQGDHNRGFLITGARYHQAMAEFLHSLAAAEPTTEEAQ